jgi:hypothetical protein
MSVPVVTRISALLLALLVSPATFTSVEVEKAGSRIDIAEFRRLERSLSEPEGYFDTDNLISNESGYLKVIPALKRLAARGGVYIGVGPDQNFSYIAAVQPALAIIIDIRRQNSLQHLYFKTLFHMSRTRAEYLERLFGRPSAKKARWAPDSKVADILGEISATKRNQDFIESNIQETFRLLREWKLELGPADFNTIRYIANAFVDGGPDLKFSSYNRLPRPYYPTYRELLAGTDAGGVPASYLATEGNFRLIKKLQEDNLIIPIVGNLAGTQALRQVARELRQRHLEVTCIYASNVEFYLFGGAGWRMYVDNVAALPSTKDSYLIRSYANGWQTLPGQRSGNYMTTILQSIRSFLANEAGGKNATYGDLITRDSISY